MFDLQESKIETYERMWQLMSSSPGLFVQSSKEGIARVKVSGYKISYLDIPVSRQYMCLLPKIT